MFDRKAFMKKLWANPRFKKKQLKLIAKGQAESDGMERTWEGNRQAWADPVRRRKRRRRMRVGCKIRSSRPEYLKKITEVNRERYRRSRFKHGGGPNKLEQFVKDLSKGCYFRYTGDGRKWIAGHCPDLLNHSRRKIVEVNGDHWHKNGIDRKRMNDYRRAGYDVLVVWEHDVHSRPASVRCKILRFVDN